MLTIKEAAQKCGKSEKTVRSWCEKGYIRGARARALLDDYQIPACFKEPYTGRRCGKKESVYTSIVRGILQDYDVCAALYSLSEEEFEKYIRELLEAKIIDTVKIGKITYFCRTMKSEEFVKIKNDKVAEFIRNSKLNVNVNFGINVGK